MSFVKYHHLEKLGHEEVADILEGTVTVYPKLDGTNASVWRTGHGVQAGSRNRHLLPDGNDNQGFRTWVQKQEGLSEFLFEHPEHRLYGEWLVPHTLKTYRDEAWERFWVFDVFVEGVLYPAENFHEAFEAFEIDYITPLAKIKNPTEEQLLNILNKTNTFLINDGAGPGEGIVIKRYGQWRNFQGRQVWAKMVRNEFKEANQKTFGMKETEGKRQVEAEIVAEFVTGTLVKKELAKIVNDLAQDKALTGALHGSDYVFEKYNQALVTHRAKIIPRLLQTVFYCLVKEEAWSFVKKYKNPKIDFAKLYRLCVTRTKELTPELL